MNGKEYSQRRFRRYDVSQYAGIETDIGSLGPKKLMNLSLGGCCIYELQADRHLVAQERVICKIRSSEGEYELEARVVHVRCLDFKDKKVVQYGFEFSLESRDALSSLMDHLDYLSQTGEVRLL